MRFLIASRICDGRISSYLITVNPFAVKLLERIIPKTDDVCLTSDTVIPPLHLILGMVGAEGFEPCPNFHIIAYFRISMGALTKIAKYDKIHVNKFVQEKIPIFSQGIGVFTTKMFKPRQRKGMKTWHIYPFAG